MIRLRIARSGVVRGLWSDDLDLAKLGTLRVQRASYVEFDQREQRWTVVSAAAPGRVLFRAASRRAALAWEAEHFGPGGPHWSPCTHHTRST